MLLVMLTTACLLMTWTPGVVVVVAVVVPFSHSMARLSGGKMSAALVTATDAGRIIGRISWISGRKDAILRKYPSVLGGCIRVG